jgi:hypothetical protein
MWWSRPNSAFEIVSPACVQVSKNFLATHQLDVDFCTEFLCVPCWERRPSRLVYR